MVIDHNTANSKNPTKDQCERLLVAHFRVKYIDVLHLKLFYRYLHEWMKLKRWTCIYEGDETKGSDRHEPFYLQRNDIYQRRIYRIWWRMENFPDRKANRFYRYRMDVDYYCRYIQDIDIMHEGKKIKVQKGQCEVTVRAWVELDYLQAWKKHWLLKHLKDLVTKRVIESILDVKKRELYRDIYEFQGTMKRILRLKGFLPKLDLETWHTQRGYRP